jgi:simple sugar transport system permease protein
VEKSEALAESQHPSTVAAATRDTIFWRLFRRPESGVVMAAVAIFVFFALFAPYFLTINVMSNILLLSAELGMVAVGVTMLMVSGEFDLSVGSVLGVAAALVVVWLNAGWPAPLAIFAALIVCGGIGVLNGILVTRLGIHSLIVTLGGLMFYRAVVLAITGGFPIRFDEDDFPFLDIFNFWWGAIPGTFLWFVVFIIIFTIVLTSTKFGNWIYASGGGRDAANEMGVPVHRVKIMAFACASMLAASAGIIQMSRLNSVDALRGSMLELEAVLAVVVGGALLTGGRGSIIGAALGVIMVSMIKQGLILMGIPAFWFKAGIGVVLILAAYINHRVQQEALK